MEAPTLVLVAWLPPRMSRPKRLRRLIKAELDRASADRVRCVLVLTNSEEAAVPSVSVPVVHVGPSRLARLLDESDQRRLEMPSVLGIRDVGELIPDAALARSTADVAAARELARVFVPTTAYALAVEVLRSRRFAVLTGPPEMGKTAIARMIALALQTAGWEAHECIRPEQVWAAFARDRAQVFVADDAFGSTEYRPDAAERWALELDRILRAMDDRHWLIWTSRPAPLRAGLRRLHREHGLERFPQPAEVQVDAAALGVDEKALILFRHAKAVRLPRTAVNLVRHHGWEIVSHRHFTPERIRRFVGERLLALAEEGAPASRVAAVVAAEIREPTIAMAASFLALSAEHRAVLVALLDSPPEPVPQRELAAALRRHYDEGFRQTPTELLDRLTDHFLRLVSPASVSWVHPSWRDLVIAQLAADPEARSRFLERCGLEGILLALSVGGGAGERVLPLLRDDRDWDAAVARITRLVTDLDDASAIRLLETLRAALEAPSPDRERAETVALTQLALQRLARHCDDRRVPVSLALLEAWFAVAEQLTDPPPAPRLGETWVELVPTAPVELSSRKEVVRFDDWLALVGILQRFAPEELQRFGFPERQHHVVAAFVADASQPRGETQELVERVLERIRMLVPAYGPSARKAQALASRPDPWFEVRFETHARRRTPAGWDRKLVQRVLRDLGDAGYSPESPRSSRR